MIVRVIRSKHITVPTTFRELVSGTIIRRTAKLVNHKKWYKEAILPKLEVFKF